MREVYFDNAATTKISDEVLDVIKAEDYFNPSGNYAKAKETAKKIETARELIADTINCEPSEIYFTSGGSEADNWAIKGVIMANKGWFKPHVVTSVIEHHAILNSCDALSRGDYANVTYVIPDRNGVIGADQVSDAINSHTELVSIMFVNNEIGTREPIEEIAKVCKAKRILFHTDAVQAYGKYKIDVQKTPIDMLSVSGHKFHAPKGIGFLYIRKGTGIAPLIDGGQQESGMRAGTENVGGIIGLAKAAAIAVANMEEVNNHEKELKYTVLSELLQRFPEMTFNGHELMGSPSILNINMSNYRVRGEEMLAFLDQFGIMASSGSACNSKSNRPSHVLKGIGLTDKAADSSIRISFSKYNTMDEVEYFLDVFRKGIEGLRRADG